MAKIIENIRNKIKSEALFLAFGLVAIVVFFLNSLTIFLNKPITTSFAYASVIIGLGLMFESKIREVLTQRKKNDKLYGVAKIITFIVGLAVFIGGWVTFPAFKLTLSQTWIGVFGFANIMAMIVIFYELFLIE